MTERSGKGPDKSAKKAKKASSAKDKKASHAKRSEGSTGKKSGKKSGSKKRSAAGKKRDRAQEKGPPQQLPPANPFLLPTDRLIGSFGESALSAPVFPPTTELAPLNADVGELHAEPAAGSEPTQRRPHRAFRIVVHLLSIVVIAGLIALGLRLFVFQAFYVPSASMVPTLAVGDRIVVDKLAFHASGLRSGDIVVFSTPAAAREECVANEGDLVKRVIATPGQVIWSIGNTVYVNGHQLPEPYLRPNTPLGRSIVRQRLGPDDFFVMGDNRGISCDSRYWGPLPGTAIIGRVFVTIWHNGHPDLHLF